MVVGIVLIVLDINKTYTALYANNLSNSWICFEFVKSEIITTNYSIKTVNNVVDDHPKNWVIQCSEDRQK